MTDRGIKLAKDGKTIESTNPDDYNLWTKYPPLGLLEKKTITLTATSEDCGSKFETVMHDYAFIPMVLATVAKTSGVPIEQHGHRYFLPAADFANINCDYGLYQFLGFNYRVKIDRVEIIWQASCGIQNYEECPLTTQTFTVELYFYLWELGSKWPPNS